MCRPSKKTNLRLNFYFELTQEMQEKRGYKYTLRLPSLGKSGWSGFTREGSVLRAREGEREGVGVYADSWLFPLPTLSSPRDRRRRGTETSAGKNDQLKTRSTRQTSEGHTHVNLYLLAHLLYSGREWVPLLLLVPFLPSFFPPRAKGHPGRVQTWSPRVPGSQDAGPVGEVPRRPDRPRVGCAGAPASLSSASRPSLLGEWRRAARVVVAAMVPGVEARAAPQRRRRRPQASSSAAAAMSVLAGGGAQCPSWVTGPTCRRACARGWRRAGEGADEGRALSARAREPGRGVGDDNCAAGGVSVRGLGPGRTGEVPPAYGRGPATVRGAKVQCRTAWAGGDPRRTSGRRPPTWDTRVRAAPGVTWARTGAQPRTESAPRPGVTGERDEKRRNESEGGSAKSPAQGRAGSGAERDLGCRPTRAPGPVDPKVVAGKGGLRRQIAASPGTRAPAVRVPSRHQPMDGRPSKVSGERPRRKPSRWARREGIRQEKGERVNQEITKVGD